MLSAEKKFSPRILSVGACEPHLREEAVKIGPAKNAMISHGEDVVELAIELLVEVAGQDLAHVRVNLVHHEALASDEKINTSTGAARAQPCRP